jgi:succinate-semialdehyde dehydrogenase / glutarate-semialdehyde dehydrogenase
VLRIRSGRIAAFAAVGSSGRRVVGSSAGASTVGVMSTYQTVNPATGELVAEFPTLDEQGVERALARAAAGFETWRATSPAERAAVLTTVARLYDERADELAAMITLEMGKPVRQAAGEVTLSSMIYQYYADHGPALLADERLDVPGAEETVVRTLPVGPLIGVMPWNFPYYQVARFAAPNLMLGNTVLLKHAPTCPQSALLMEEIFVAAGLPADAYVNIFASNEQIADMIADPRVQGVSLTGSERAGAAVAEVAGRNLKKVVLELGGSDAFIVLDSDDLDATVKSATRGRMANTGQACNAAKRFVVLEPYYDEFVAKLSASFAAMVPGDPTDPATVIGPLSSQAAADTLTEQVENAVAEGATVLTGGRRLDGPGAYVEPTLLTGVTPGMRAYSEELFGPVGVVYKVGSADEAVELTNDSSFGLSGSVWSSDLDKAREVADRLDVGMAFVNEHGTSLPGLPFGGVKRSGFGRELGPWGMEEFVNKKLVRVSKG